RRCAARSWRPVRAGGCVSTSPSDILAASRVRRRPGERYRLDSEALAIVDPALGVKPCFGEDHLSCGSVGNQIADAIGEPVAGARRTALGGAVAEPDPSKADDVGPLGNRAQR